MKDRVQELSCIGHFVGYVSDDKIGVKELDYYEIRNVGYLRALLANMLTKGVFRFTLCLIHPI